MVEIIKGRYGYADKDGAIKVAVPGMRIELSQEKEDKLILQGVAKLIEEKPKKIVRNTEKTEPSKNIKKKTSRKKRKVQRDDTGSIN